jgi:hypothetical protein
VLLGNGDRLDILGDLAADDGRLRIAGQGALEGTVGATQDGQLILDRALGLTETSQVSVGLGGAGLDAQAGRIATAGTAVLDGTFAFDITEQLCLHLERRHPGCRCHLPAAHEQLRCIAPPRPDQRVHPERRSAARSLPEQRLRTHHAAL